ncbi:MAG: hypothetical protein PHG40_02555, partial [Candidatus Omnitrophica bacterium]|nr:hypothetical protein [Candidatus Omnitrophota bacterium]
IQSGKFAVLGNGQFLTRQDDGSYKGTDGKTYTRDGDNFQGFSNTQTSTLNGKTYTVDIVSKNGQTTASGFFVQNGMIHKVTGIDSKTGQIQGTLYEGTSTQISTFNGQTKTVVLNTKNGVTTASGEFAINGALYEVTGIDAGGQIQGKLVEGSSTQTSSLNGKTYTLVQTIKNGQLISATGSFVKGDEVYEVTGVANGQVQGKLNVVASSDVKITEAARNLLIYLVILRANSNLPAGQQPITLKDSVKKQEALRNAPLQTLISELTGAQNSAGGLFFNQENFWNQNNADAYDKLVAILSGQSGAQIDPAALYQCVLPLYEASKAKETFQKYVASADSVTAKYPALFNGRNEPIKVPFEFTEQMGQARKELINRVLTNAGIDPAAKDLNFNDPKVQAAMSTVETQLGLFEKFAAAFVATKQSLGHFDWKGNDRFSLTPAALGGIVMTGAANNAEGVIIQAQQMIQKNNGLLNAEAVDLATTSPAYARVEEYNAYQTLTPLEKAIREMSSTVNLTPVQDFYRRVAIIEGKLAFLERKIEERNGSIKVDALTEIMKGGIDRISTAPDESYLAPLKLLQEGHSAEAVIALENLNKEQGKKVSWEQEARRYMQAAILLDDIAAGFRLTTIKLHDADPLDLAGKDVNMLTAQPAAALFLAKGQHERAETAAIATGVAALSIQDTVGETTRAKGQTQLDLINVSPSLINMFEKNEKETIAAAEIFAQRWDATAKLALKLDEAAEVRGELLSRRNFIASQGEGFVALAQMDEANLRSRAATIVDGILNGALVFEQAKQDAGRLSIEADWVAASLGVSANQFEAELIKRFDLPEERREIGRNNGVMNPLEAQLAFLEDAIWLQQNHIQAAETAINNGNYESAQVHLNLVNEANIYVNAGVALNGYNRNNASMDNGSPVLPSPASPLQEELDQKSRATSIYLSGALTRGTNSLANSSVLVSHNNIELAQAALTGADLRLGTLPDKANIASLTEVAWRQTNAIDASNYLPEIFQTYRDKDGVVHDIYDTRRAVFSNMLSLIQDDATSYHPEILNNAYQRNTLAYDLSRITADSLVKGFPVSQAAGWIGKLSLLSTIPYVAIDRAKAAYPVIVGTAGLIGKIFVNTIVKPLVGVGVVALGWVTELPSSRIFLGKWEVGKVGKVGLGWVVNGLSLGYLGKNLQNYDGMNFNNPIEVLNKSISAAHNADFAPAYLRATLGIGGYLGKAAYIYGTGRAFGTNIGTSVANSILTEGGELVNLSLGGEPLSAENTTLIAAAPFIFGKVISPVVAPFSKYAPWITAPKGAAQFAKFTAFWAATPQVVAKAVRSGLTEEEFLDLSWQTNKKYIIGAAENAVSILLTHGINKGLDIWQGSIQQRVAKHRIFTSYPDGTPGPITNIGRENVERVLLSAIRGANSYARIFGIGSLAVDNAVTPGLNDKDTWDTLMFTGNSFGQGAWKGALFGGALGLVGGVAQYGNISRLASRGMSLEQRMLSRQTTFGALTGTEKGIYAFYRAGRTLSFLYNPAFQSTVGHYQALSRGITYLTWPTTAVAGRYLVEKAFGTDMTADDALETIITAVDARFLASPMKFAQYLRGATEAKGAGNFILRHGIIGSVAAAQFIAKDFAVGELEKRYGYALGDQFLEYDKNHNLVKGSLVWGQTTPGQIFMSGVRGLVYGELARYFVSPNGLNYFRGVVRHVQKYESAEVQQLRVGWLKQRGINLYGNGAAQRSLDAIEGAIKWPFVSMNMEAFKPVFDTALTAAGRGLDTLFRIPLGDQPILGFNIDVKDETGRVIGKVWSLFRQEAPKGGYLPLAFFGRGVENIRTKNDKGEETGLSDLEFARTVAGAEFFTGQRALNWAGS